MRITVVTPTVRPEGLDMVAKCLKRQTFKDYEWVVVSPFKFVSKDKRVVWVQEPPKKEGDYYGLNKAWNAAFKIAQGDLVVSIVDLLWFPPNLLEYLWTHFEVDQMACIGGVGNQYKVIENGKPEMMVWKDPRITGKGFYEIKPFDLELCIASIPLKGIQRVGGVDEEYDKAPAWSEKDLACRLESVGYKCYIDESVEYRALQHPRLTEDWDDKYPESVARFQKDYKLIQEGKRKKLDYL